MEEAMIKFYGAKPQPGQIFWEFLRTGRRGEVMARYHSIGGKQATKQYSKQPNLDKFDLTKSGLFHPSLNLVSDILPEH